MSREKKGRRPLYTWPRNLNDDWLKNEYLINEKSISELSKEIGVGRHLVHKKLQAILPYLKKRGSQPGKKNHAWKGGIRIEQHGYVLNWVGKDFPGADSKGYIRQSRLIAARALGRSLKKEEVVHHHNKNKQDDRNSNLIICNQPYHLFLHKRMRCLEKRRALQITSQNLA
jgi:hypothetical protein